MIGSGSEKLAWRANFLKLRLQGKLPGYPWWKTVYVLAPNSWKRAANPEDLLFGFAKFVDRDDTRPCPVLWETPEGRFWARDSDEMALEVTASEQARHLYCRKNVGVRESDIVLDVGGHAGLFTRHALNHGARLVVVFEPDPLTAQCFRMNLEKELSDGSVVLIEAAAWEKPGTLHFASSPDGNSGASRVSEKGGVEVDAVTIDDTVRKLGLERVDFIKMDIEGAERHALLGAAETLAANKPRMVLCVYHREDDTVVIPEVVMKLQPEYTLIRELTQAYFH